MLILYCDIQKIEVDRLAILDLNHARSILIVPFTVRLIGAISRSHFVFSQI